MSASEASMASAGLIVGLVRYLCLNKTVFDILVACVLFIAIFQHL